MRQYEFLSVWHIDAPLGAVWRTIHDADAWPEWWRGVVSVVKLKEGDETGVGSIRRTTWKSALPYKLEFDSEVVSVKHERTIETRAFGELEGVGIWHFIPEGDSLTRVEYDWRVVTNKTWMNLVYPIAKPFFKWNHDVIMGWGEEGLKKRLSATAR